LVIVEAYLMMLSEQMMTGAWMSAGKLVPLALQLLTTEPALAS
jgi:hypothetical protein